MDWDENFNVDIEVIDGQHKQLVSLINKLHEAMIAGKSREVLEDIITQLIEYTRVHFATEEELFSRFGYGDTVSHVAAHQKFIESVEDFHRDFQNKKLGVSVDILNFLLEWLKTHILGSDKKYGPFLAEKLKSRA